MFTLLGLIFKIVFLVIGIFFVMAGINEWKWAMRLVLGKRTVTDMGQNMSKIIFILIGIVMIMLTLWWIF